MPRDGGADPRRVSRPAGHVQRAGGVQALRALCRRRPVRVDGRSVPRRGIERHAVLGRPGGELDRGRGRPLARPAARDAAEDLRGDRAASASEPDFPRAGGCCREAGVLAPAVAGAMRGLAGPQSSRGRAGAGVVQWRGGAAGGARRRRSGDRRRSGCGALGSFDPRALDRRRSVQHDALRGARHHRARADGEGSHLDRRVRREQTRRGARAARAARGQPGQHDAHRIAACAYARSVVGIRFFPRRRRTPQGSAGCGRARRAGRESAVPQGPRVLSGRGSLRPWT